MSARGAKQPSLRLAYCRDCKVVIAVGEELAVDQTYRPTGESERTVRAGLYHTVDGVRHDDVGTIDIGPRSTPTGDVGKWMKALETEFKSRFV